MKNLEQRTNQYNEALQVTVSQYGSWTNWPEEAKQNLCLMKFRILAPRFAHHLTMNNIDEHFTAALQESNTEGQEAIMAKLFAKAEDRQQLVGVISDIDKLGVSKGVRV